MDGYNLRTAATYVNNLLLARGLLRNGAPIEFAHPSKGEGGKEATMAQIINLVHDLILRRDRESEHHEAIAQTLRALRTEQTDLSTTASQLRTENDKLTRQLSLAQSAERSAKSALKAAEAQMRLLREDAVRLKTSVSQIRASCANDIRKRDVQIQRLKGHLTEQQRGNRSGVGGASVTITPGMSAPAKSGRTMIGGSTSRSKADVQVYDAGYSLRQETTEFLTQLSQNLSDENDALIAVVRDSLATLRELQGMPENAQRAAAPLDALEGQDHQMMQVLPTSCYVLGREMAGVLDNLRSILTNPNFVPIEEVASREEEIARLREGWEMMEARWREALNLMDGWRQRMLEGDTVNLEDLRQGFGLAGGLGPLAEEEEEAASEAPEDDVRSEDLDDMLADELEHEPLQAEPGVIPTKQSSQPERDPTTAIPTTSQPLQDTHGNTAVPPSRKATTASTRLNHRKASTVTPADENSEVDLLPTPTTKALNSPASAQTSAPRSLRDTITRARDIKARAEKTSSSQPRKNLKRHSSPTRHSDEPSPKMSVQEKLNIARAEAEAAAVAAGLKLDDLDVRVDEESFREGRPAAVSAATTKVPLKGSPTKATGIKGRARRRKSTLTPEELERLMSF